MLELNNVIYKIFNWLSLREQLNIYKTNKYFKQCIIQYTEKKDGNTFMQKLKNKLKYDFHGVTKCNKTSFCEENICCEKCGIPYCKIREMQKKLGFDDIGYYIFDSRNNLSNPLKDISYLTIPEFVVINNFNEVICNFCLIRNIDDYENIVCGSDGFYADKKISYTY